MKLNVVKIGGNVIDSPSALSRFLTSFTKIEGLKVLVHGGGKMTTELSKALGLETKMVEGRRITDAETLKVTTMVYGGLINKEVVALLQAKGCDAIGLSGADANVLQATKREITTINYGFVGDTDSSMLNVARMQLFLNNGLTPVFCALTHDGMGQLLNTNADTVAAVIAIGMSDHYEVTLHYCFEKKGVLKKVEDENSIIPIITEDYYAKMYADKVITEGMIPKLDNAFTALRSGVKNVIIGHGENILETGAALGTIIKLS